MYGYEDEEGGGQRNWVRIAIGALVILLVAAGAYYIGNRDSGGNDNANAALPIESTPASAALPASATPTTAAAGGPRTTAPRQKTTTTRPATTTTAATTTTDATTTTGATTTTAATTTTEATTTTRAPATTRAPTTTRPSTTTTNAPPGEPKTYDTLPDGSPEPVQALFDVNQITLTGAVPSQAAKERLQTLALANAKPGQDHVVNFLTINPDVPINVGVRVVELTSARFPTGSADVSPEQSLELDRVVSIMNALPNITALVIGHSDQRGSEATNYQLSAARADAVVNYLASKGINPSRLSSRAVGEQDLLTLNNDAAALALNRRTEFTFYGLLNQ